MPTTSLRNLLAVLAAAAAALAFAQEPLKAAPDKPVDAALAAEAVEGAAAALERAYVFEDMGRRMAAMLREKARAGGYAAAGTGRALARAITEDCQSLSRDKHLRVVFGAPPGNPHGIPAFANHGFEKAEVLPGNVGYLEVRTFMGDTAAWERAAAEAMARLATTDALIVDLRRNGGGDPRKVAMLTSYLFGEEPVHLNDLYWRERDRTDEFWTSKAVAGPRYGAGKPVYVLTSKRTFSGAEEFSYNLKALKRATIVGETTGGGAHPVSLQPLAGEFVIFVPTGRAINPITKGNWEGTGVAPDVAVPAEEALERAAALARARAS